MVNASIPWVVLNAIVSQDTNLMSRLISASIKMNVVKEVQITVMWNTDIIENFIIAMFANPLISTVFVLESGPPACYGLAQCINTPGSFKCTCPNGYELDASGLSCVDIDECSENNNICRNGECNNMEGSFQCKCLDGFVLGGSRRNTCIDHDECVLNPFICGKNGKIYWVVNGKCLKWTLNQDNLVFT